jgi:hypothetical protein
VFGLVCVNSSKVRGMAWFGSAILFLQKLSLMSLLLLMRHYLSALEVLAYTIIVVVCYCWGDVLTIYIDQVLIHSSKGTLYYNDLVLDGLIGHRVEQQARPH